MYVLVLLVGADSTIDGDSNSQGLETLLAGIDADIVLKVSSKPADSEACRGLLAGAMAFYAEDATLRPVYGLVELCQINPADFLGDLSTTVHEVLHALVRSLPGLQV
jgi:hypothetical protein